MFLYYSTRAGKTQVFSGFFVENGKERGLLIAIARKKLYNKEVNKRVRRLYAVRKTKKKEIIDRGVV